MKSELRLYPCGIKAYRSNRRVKALIDAIYELVRKDEIKTLVSRKIRKKVPTKASKSSKQTRKSLHLHHPETSKRKTR
jgi:dTDP-4-dehydrorhamnose 3,5-epimerase-like enzyme